MKIKRGKKEKTKKCILLHMSKKKKKKKIDATEIQKRVVRRSTVSFKTHRENMRQGEQLRLETKTERGRERKQKYTHTRTLTHTTHAHTHSKTWGVCRQTRGSAHSHVGLECVT